MSGTGSGRLVTISTPTMTARPANETAELSAPDHHGSAGDVWITAVHRVAGYPRPLTPPSLRPQRSLGRETSWWQIVIPRKPPGGFPGCGSPKKAPSGALSDGAMPPRTGPLAREAAAMSASRVIVGRQFASFSPLPRPRSPRPGTATACSSLGLCATTCSGGHRPTASRGRVP
jgi:hypothetical protein